MFQRQPVFLVAHDTAPSQGLKKLLGHLDGQKTSTISLFSGDPAVLRVSFDSALEGEGFIMVCGMSSSLKWAEEEIEAARFAKRRGMPLFFYADTFGVYRRPWFAEFMPGSTLFVINELEAELARKALPETDVVVTGNPMWEDFFFPKYTKQQVFEELALPPGTQVVLVPGGKSTGINVLHFAEALRQRAADHDGILVIIAPHPGDKTDLAIYQELIDISETNSRLIPNSHMSASDMLPAASLVFESASTIGIEAAHQGILVVNYFSSLALQRLQKATGRDVWPLCEQKVAILSNDYDRKLSDCFSDLIEDQYNQRYIERAEALYPRITERGLVVKKMVNAISEKLSGIRRVHLPPASLEIKSPDDDIHHIP